MQASILKPPAIVKGMMKLDKSKFLKEIEVPILKLKQNKISNVISTLKKYILKLENFKPVVPLEGEKVPTTVVHLNPIKIQTWSDIEHDDQISLGKYTVTESDVSKKKITLRFENYSTIDILNSVLPSEPEGFSSFTFIGHIIHVNLREHLLPYKYFIGQVLLDKNTRCKTVVNKVDIIDNVYRNFQMEILAGEENTVTKVKENNCTFVFDFRTVYWNSRLSSEHERLVKSFEEGDVLFDVFGGVGPFSIPAAKKKCTVFCNDLNPESYKWLNHNAKINKVDDRYFTSFNKDGADFILTDLKENLLKYVNSKNVHIVMNLPASAVCFLKYFVGLYGCEELKTVTFPPNLYLYCFCKGEDYVKIAKSLVCEAVAWDITDFISDIFKVRTVSSYKDMVRVTLKLKHEILTGKTNRKRKLNQS